MAETHHIVGPPRGEPLPAGRVGARVRVPLSGTPSSQWSRVLTARLTAALTGHQAVGHLHLAGVIQGADIVLDGVEAAEADRLGEAIGSAVAAANRSGAQEAPGMREHNMSREQANDIARQIKLHHESDAGRKASSERFPGR